jgi:hypothetical protein
MHPIDRPIHGAYINDDRRWHYSGEKITADRAAELLGIPQTERAPPGVCHNCKNQKPAKKTCWACSGTGHQREYLWMNKGFIVIGHPVTLPQKRIHDQTYPDGTRAIYIADGNYLVYTFCNP